MRCLLLARKSMALAVNVIQNAYPFTAKEDSGKAVLAVNMAAKKKLYMLYTTNYTNKFLKGVCHTGGEAFKEDWFTVLWY